MTVNVAKNERRQPVPSQNDRLLIDKGTKQLIVVIEMRKGNMMLAILCRRTDYKKRRFKRHTSTLAK
jgi:hypothetical protein